MLPRPNLCPADRFVGDTFPVLGHDNRELAAVFVGGAIGTLARAGLAEAVVHDPVRWPWATYVVNIVGAVLLGYLSTRLPQSGYSRSLLGTGVCGGLTTFSTMQLELLGMVEQRAHALAASYLAASVAAGLLAVHLGAMLARSTGRSRP